MDVSRTIMYGSLQARTTNLSEFLPGLDHLANFLVEVELNPKILISDFRQHGTTCASAQDLKFGTFPSKISHSEFRAGVR